MTTSGGEPVELARSLATLILSGMAVCVLIAAALMVAKLVRQLREASHD